MMRHISLLLPLPPSPPPPSFSSSLPPLSPSFLFLLFLSPSFSFSLLPLFLLFLSPSFYSGSPGACLPRICSYQGCWEGPTSTNILWPTHVYSSIWSDWSKEPGSNVEERSGSHQDEVQWDFREAIGENKTIPKVASMSVTSCYFCAVWVIYFVMSLSQLIYRECMKPLEGEFHFIDCPYVCSLCQDIR